MSEPLRHGSWVNSAEFNRQGDRLVTVSIRSSAQVWEVPLVPLPVPLWLADLAEAIADQRWDDHGNLQRVAPDALGSIRESLLRSMSEDPYTRWAKWFFADREARPISVSASVSKAELIRRLSDQDSYESLTLALKLAPLEPAVLARLGWRLVSQRWTYRSEQERAERLTRLATELGPEEAYIWALRADVLEVVGKVDAARQAAARALELDPEDPNAWWAKAFILKKAGNEDEAYAAFVRSVELTLRPSASGLNPQPFLHGTLRQIRALGLLDAEKCAGLATSRLSYHPARRPMEADWLSRRAVDLAAEKEKSVYWQRRSEALRMTRQLLTAIAEPPVSQHAHESGAVTFQIGMRADEPVQLQWQRDGMDLPGATNPTLTLSNVSLADVGAYSVLVHGISSGSKIAEVSQPAALTLESGDLIHGLDEGRARQRRQAAQPNPK